MYEAHCYKDSFNGTRAPWRADLYFEGELFITAWQYGCRSLRELKQNIEACHLGGATIEIVRKSELDS